MEGAPPLAPKPCTYEAVIVLRMFGDRPMCIVELAILQYQSQYFLLIVLVWMTVVCCCEAIVLITSLTFQ